MGHCVQNLRRKYRAYIKVKGVLAQYGNDIDGIYTAVVVGNASMQYRLGDTVSQARGLRLTLFSKES